MAPQREQPSSPDLDQRLIGLTARLPCPDKERERQAASYTAWAGSIPAAALAIPRIFPGIKNQRGFCLGALGFGL